MGRIFQPVQCCNAEMLSLPCCGCSLLITVTVCNTLAFLHSNGSPHDSGPGVTVFSPFSKPSVLLVVLISAAR